MSPITTHILDTSCGRPAAGVRVVLEALSGHRWENLGSGSTNDDGRVTDLLPEDSALEAGTYRLRFEVGDYFEDQQIESFYPFVEVVFRLEDPAQHYHVPLLLNPFGYSTYRGS